MINQSKFVGAIFLLVLSCSPNFTTAAQETEMGETTFIMRGNMRPLYEKINHNVEFSDGTHFSFVILETIGTDVSETGAVLEQVNLSPGANPIPLRVTNDVKGAFDEIYNVSVTGIECSPNDDIECSSVHLKLLANFKPAAKRSDDDARCTFKFEIDGQMSGRCKEIHTD